MCRRLLLRYCGKLINNSESTGINSCGETHHVSQSVQKCCEVEDVNIDLWRGNKKSRKIFELTCQLNRRGVYGK